MQYGLVQSSNGAKRRGAPITLPSIAWRPCRLSWDDHDDISGIKPEAGQRLLGLEWLPIEQKSLLCSRNRGLDFYNSLQRLHFIVSTQLNVNDPIIKCANCKLHDVSQITPKNASSGGNSERCRKADLRANLSRR